MVWQHGVVQHAHDHLPVKKIGSPAWCKTWWLIVTWKAGWMAGGSKRLPGTRYLFGNMRGQKYTKGGWKSSLDALMFACVEEAAKRGMPFTRFSLQECRPMAVTDKLERGDTDTKTATGHTSDKMIATVYDRRPQRVATGARLAKNTG